MNGLIAGPRYLGITDGGNGATVVGRTTVTAVP